MTLALEIRAASLEDVDALAEIHVASFALAHRGLMPDEEIDTRTVELRRGMWQARLQAPPPRDIVLVGVLDGALAGFVSAGEVDSHANGDADTSFLQNVYLHPDVVGTPAGRAVIEALHAELLVAMRAHGFRTATSKILTGNERSRRMFLRLGWQHDDAAGAEPTPFTNFRRSLES